MTLGELLDALGGNLKVAEALGIAGNVVSMWRLRGRVPARFQFRLWAMALSSDLDWEPEGGVYLRPFLAQAVAA